MSIIKRDRMSAICLPMEEFNYDNLDVANSTFTESDPLPGQPTRVNASPVYNLETVTREGLSDTYDIDFRFADSGGGSLGSDNPPEFVWRDEDGDWFGWQGIKNVFDIETANENGGSSTHHNQGPRMAFDRVGNVVVVSRYNGRPRCAYRAADSSTWTEVYVTNAGETTVSGDTSAAGARVDPDVVYVEEDEAFYCFYQTWDDNTETKCSVGVSISVDCGATWYQITREIVPMDDSLDATNDTAECLRNIRALYNPLTRSFTVAAEYQEGITNGIQYMSFSKSFTGTSWKTLAEDFVWYPDLVYLPKNQTEYIFYYNSDDEQIEYRTKSGGTTAFSAFVTGHALTKAASAIDLSVGTPVYVHPSGTIYGYVTDTSGAPNIAGFRLLSDGSIEQIGEAASTPQTTFPTTLSTSGLINTSVKMYRDEIWMIGNPNAVDTDFEDQSIILKLGGWSNLPVMIPNVSWVGPWDDADDQDRPQAWAPHVVLPGVAEPDFGADYLALKITASSSTAESSYQLTTVDGENGGFVVFKVQMENGYTNVNVLNSVQHGYAFYGVNTDDTTNMTKWRVLVAKNDWNIYDAAGSTLLSVSNIAESSVTAPIIIAVAWSHSTTELKAWSSRDGKTWDLKISTAALGTDVSASATEQFHYWGMYGHAGSTSNSSYWSFVKVMTDNALQLSSIILSYDPAVTPTSDVDLEGMPLDNNQYNYVTKGLLVRGTTGSVGARELWSLQSVARKGITNALFGGADSPSLQWIESGPTSATLVWDHSDAPFMLEHGFIYWKGKGLTSMTLVGQDTTTANRTLMTATNRLFLDAPWARLGNSIYPTGANVSNDQVYYELNELKGSWWRATSTNYYKITYNSPGYFSTDQGDARMMFVVEGDPSGEASSGSTTSLHSDTVLAFWRFATYATCYKKFTLTMTAEGSAGAALTSGNLFIGRYYPIAVPTDVGRSRGWVINHSRVGDSQVTSTGSKLGNSARTRSFTVTSADNYTKYDLLTTAQTNTVGWHASNPVIDIHSAPDVLSYAFQEYGKALPIVWCDRWDETDIYGEPDGSSAKLGGREVLMGYIDMDSIAISNGSSTEFWGEIQQLSNFTIREIV